MKRCCKTMHAGPHAEFKIKRAAQMRQWRADNLAHAIEYERRHREKNRDKYREYVRRWREKNRDKCMKRGETWRSVHPEYQKQYYRLNRDKVLAANLAWRRRHPDRMRKLEKEKARRSMERLTDSYVKRLLRLRTVRGVPAALIEAKRVQVMICRLTRSTT